MNEESTIMEKLDYLEGTKTSIKNAIISKGQEVDDNDTFRSYAQKIANIETGTDTSDATAVADDIVKGKTAYGATGKITGIIKEYNENTESYVTACNNTTTSNPEEQIYCNNTLDSNCTQIVLNNGAVIPINSLPVDVTGKNIAIWHVVSKAATTESFYTHTYLLGIASDLTDVFWIDSVNFHMYCANADKTAAVTATYYKMTKQDSNPDYIALDSSFNVEGPNSSNYMNRYDVALEGVYSTTNLYGGTKLSQATFLRNKGASIDYMYYQKVNTGQYVSPAVIKRHADVVTLFNNTKLATTVGLTANKIAEGEKILGITGTYAGTDTSDATATAERIEEGYTAYVDGEKITGTLKPLQQYNFGDASYPAEKVAGANKIRVKCGLNTNGLLLRDDMDNNIWVSIIQSYSGIANAIGLQASQIAKGSTVLGIEGTHEGGEDLTEELTAQQAKIEELEALLQNKCDFQFKIYDTVAHMEEAEAQEGDKAVVYTETSNTYNFEGFYRYNGTDWIKLSADIS